MARVCELTGKKVAAGNKVSHSNIKTRTRWLPNLQKKRYVVSELGWPLTLTLSTSAIKTIDKVGGISKAVLKAKPQSLSPRLQKVRQNLVKKCGRAS